MFSLMHKFSSTNYTFRHQTTLVENKFTKMHLKYIYFMLRILHLHILNKNTLQLYF